MFGVFTALHVTDVRGTLLGDEVDDMLLAQRLQCLVDDRFGEFSLVSNEGLVDEAVVDEKPTIVTQKGCDDTVFVRL